MPSPLACRCRGCRWAELLAGPAAFATLALLALFRAAATGEAAAGANTPRASASATVEARPLAARAPVWREERPVPVAVVGGTARFALPTPSPRSKTLVIVSSLAKGSGPYPLRLVARPSSGVLAAPAIADDGPCPARAPVEPAPAPAVESSSSPPQPPAERTFHLMVRDGDVASASNYLAVGARLRAVGDRVQVYVDERDVANVSEDVLRDVVLTFDDRVYPVAAATMGVARDVDGDGRFTVLVTGWLTRLAGGRLAVDGFVRGADLDPDLEAPFGNRCDMMYLSASLGAGPHLRTVLAHEYTHAVTASLKAFGGPGGIRVGPEEEGWLDEALAHLAEDQHGFSRSNLDYRVSAFLSCPERYRLVVDDYYAADLFRSHGNRGSTYLFLRYCVDRYGADLLGRLARSPRRGQANLEAATGASFAALYRQWTIALALSGLAADAPEASVYQSMNLRSDVDGWPLAGPRACRVRPGAAAQTWPATGTSSRFAIVEASPTGAVEVEVTGPPEAALQVTAIPLAATSARLELAVNLQPNESGMLEARATLRELDGTSVRLSALAWEPLIPAPDARANGTVRGSLDMLGIASSCGTSALPALGTLVSRPIALAGVIPADSPLVFKATGTDSSGHRVSAWAELPLPPPRSTLASDNALPPALAH